MGKLLTLTSNIRLGCVWVAVANAIAYSDSVLIKTVKSFYKLVASQVFARVFHPSLTFDEFPPGLNG